MRFAGPRLRRRARGPGAPSGPPSPGRAPGPGAALSAQPAGRELRRARPQSELLRAMAASPGGTPDPAVEAPAPQPGAHPSEPGSVSARGGEGSWG